MATKAATAAMVEWRTPDIMVLYYNGAWYLQLFSNLFRQKNGKYEVTTTTTNGWPKRKDEKREGSRS